MDNIFGIGLPEFILIVVIAGMVMGPERIARTARSLGVLTARLQNISRSFFRQLNAELDSLDDDGQLRETVEELNQLRRQVAELRTEVFSLASGAAAESKQAVTEIRREVENSILPPDLVPGNKKPQKPSVDNAPVDAPVYGPPSLFTDEAANGGVNGAPPTTAKPPKMPKRMDVAEDPD